MLPSFLRACMGEATDRAPIWLMRQAGRYLPEYREIRKHHTFLELCKSPDLATEITLQPIRRFGFDAAILFSDLLVPVEAMGLPVQFTEQGPTLPQPVRSPDEIQRVSDFDPAVKTPFVMQTVRQLREKLGNTPLIGFAGAPFTAATYIIEGKTSKNFTETKKMMYLHPTAARDLLERVAAATARYLRAQVEAGAQAVQIFDSWVGVLSVEDFQSFVAGPTATLIRTVKQTGVPVIYFGNGASSMLEQIGQLGADVYGVDWRVPLEEARRRLGGTAVVQGNLDPCVLLGPAEEVERRTRDVLAQGGGRGHIFNLGHGVLPETPIENVQRLVSIVRGDG